MAFTMVLKEEVQLIIDYSSKFIIDYIIELVFEETKMDTICLEWYHSIEIFQWNPNAYLNGLNI